MNKIRSLVVLAAGLVVVGYGGWLVLKWGVMRVYVGPDEALKVVSKFGKDLPDDLIAVPASQPGYKGVQEDLLGPGRYFLNPVTHDWERVSLLEIPAGAPEQWEFDTDGRLLADRQGRNQKGVQVTPMIGLVSARQGRTAPAGQEVVDPGFKGLQREVLTPGVYKLNPHLYEVTVLPAVVVPPGYVGVVTRLTGDVSRTHEVLSAPLRETTTAPAGGQRIAVGETTRGILRDVLQPGIYYLNPRLYNVTTVPVGYEVVTQEHPRNAIKFYSSDGYQVEADFTVVWGIAPKDAPDIVATIGSWDRVSDNVISPAMKAACLNVGGTYSARELIQGQTRSRFQDELSASLEQQVSSRNIHVLLALVRGITITDSATGKDATEGLLRTIQRANIEVERELTNKQKTLTAKVKADLEQALKLVDVARETVASDTNVKVANILAEGQKKAAEIDAQREVAVAEIERQVATLEAQRREILGKAEADVVRLRNDAHAAGAKLLVEALGSPQAYNLYTFAKNFEPSDVRLIFAGEGTFWTDLKTFEQVGAQKLLQPAPRPAPPAPPAQK